MAKKIIWSENALQDRLLILDFWFQRIGNKKYSHYLDFCFRETVELISKFPKAGRTYKQTEFRFMVKDKYLVFYEEGKETVLILGIFDSRRNPELVKGILE